MFRRTFNDVSPTTHAGLELVQTEKHEIVRVSAEQFRELLWKEIAKRFPANSDPHEIGHGGDRRVIGSDATDWVLKIQKAASAGPDQSPVDLIRKQNFDALIQQCMPREWLLPEHHEMMPIDGIADERKYVMVDIQDRLPDAYINDKEMLMWCYGRAEDPFHQDDDSAGSHTGSATALLENVPALSSRPMRLRPDPNVRQAYIRICQREIMGDRRELFNPGEFLKVQNIRHMRRLFGRVKRDPLTRDKVADSMDGICRVANHGHIVDGMGDRNVFYPDDRNTPLIPDAMLPLPLPVLREAGKLLQECKDLRELTNDQLSYAFHAGNFLRGLGGTQEQAGMNLSRSVNLGLSRSPDFGKQYDVYFEKFAQRRQHELESDSNVKPRSHHRSRSPRPDEHEDEDVLRVR